MAETEAGKATQVVIGTQPEIAGFAAIAVLTLDVLLALAHARVLRAHGLVVVAALDRALA